MILKLANDWSLNLRILKEFANYDERFKNVQPPFAKSSELSLAEIAPWTNRVPDHEPWPRVLKQDSGDTQNVENEGYKNNVDHIDQFDNETSPEGKENIGVIEGDETIERGPLWRR